MSLEERVAQSNRLWWLAGGPRPEFHDIVDNITVEFLRQELDRQVAREEQEEASDAQAA